MPFPRSPFRTLLIALIFLQMIGGMFLVPAFAQAQTGAVTPLGNELETIVGAGGSSQSPGVVSQLVGYVLRPLGWAIRAIGMVLLFLAGTLMSSLIDYSINFPINSITGIQTGWQVMRNFANLFFIFIILFIAIKTILQLGGRETKQMLVRVIVVALLINFSMFFTKVIIDFGNVLAVGFYNAIITSPGPNGSSSQCTVAIGSVQVTSNCTIDLRIMEATNISQLTGETFNTTDEMQITLIYIISGIMLIFIAIVFFKAAFYFLVRTVAFALLIMLSPIAFLANVFPVSAVSKYWGVWWGMLWKYTLMAPVYLMVIYLVLAILQGGPLVPQGSSTMSLLLNFLLVMGLIYSGTKVAFELADNVGSKAASFAGGTALAGGALAMRQTLGRAGRGLSENKRLEDAAKKGGVRGWAARNTLLLGKSAASSSFDVTKTKYGGMANDLGGFQNPKMFGGEKAGEGGYKATGGLGRDAIKLATLGIARVGKAGTEEEKEIIERAKKYKDPELQEQYIRNQLGISGVRTKTGAFPFRADSQYDSGDNKELKDARARIAVERRKDAAEDKLKASAKELKEEKMAGNVEQVANIEKGIRDSMKEVGPRAVADLGEGVLKDIGGYLNRGHLEAIHQREAEGKYRDGAVLLSTIGQAVMNAKPTDKDHEKENEAAKEYLTSPEGQRRLFGYRIPESEKVKTKKHQLQEKNILRVQEEAAQVMNEIDQVSQEAANLSSRDIQEMKKSLQGLKAEYAELQSIHASEGTWTNDEVKQAKETTEKLRKEKRNLEKKVEEGRPVLYDASGRTIDREY